MGRGGREKLAKFPKSIQAMIRARSRMTQINYERRQVPSFAGSSLSLFLTASIVAFREKFFLETRARSAACVTHRPDSRSSIRPPNTPNLSLSLSLSERIVEEKKSRKNGRRRVLGGRKRSWRGRKKVCEKWEEEWNWSEASRGNGEKCSPTFFSNSIILEPGKVIYLRCVLS